MCEEAWPSQYRPGLGMTGTEETITATVGNWAGQAAKRDPGEPFCQDWVRCPPPTGDRISEIDKQEIGVCSFSVQTSLHIRGRDLVETTWEPLNHHSSLW